ncbi:MAG: glycosyltransferase [Planctomycetes bacterium]|nr:glycosyltransferase [Planctomycetota bacterium]MCB9870899.1 glycosyltransferase [Planctomycetota bacterium]
MLLVCAGVLAAPFGLLLFAALCATDLLVAPVRRRTEARSRNTDSASILILNWNGSAFLGQLLPSLRRAIAKHGGNHRVVVVDNGSTDDSLAVLRRDFPEVEVLAFPDNRGFVRGYNDAFHSATHDIVVLLNNDMVVDEGFLAPLLGGFDDPDTFAVSSQVFLADPKARRVETGLTAGRVGAGLLKLRHDDFGPHVTGLIPVLWAGGGSSAFDRRRLLELGGFDRLYDPFYFEDTGLSFEAWKRGWNVLLAPESKVTHHHQGSSSRLHRGYVARIKRRNQHLFSWRHLTDAGHTASTTLLLPLNLVRLALQNRGAALGTRALLEIRAMGAVVPRLPALLAARLRNARHAVRRDAEVFALAHSRHRYERCRPARSDLAASPPRLDLLMCIARVPRHGIDGSWGPLEQIRQLAQRHRITVFTLVDRPDDAPHIEALRHIVHRVEAHAIEREPGELDLHHRIPVRLRQIYTAPALRQKLRALLHTERFDVLQVDYVEMAAALDGMVAGLRSVHVVHEPLLLAEPRRRVHGLVPVALRWLRSCQAVNYECRLYPQFAHIVTLTQADADALHRFMPRLPITVNPTGVNLRGLTPCEPSSGTTLLSVCSFRHAPNVDAVLWFVQHVLPLVRAQVPEVRLRLAGADAPHSVQALARDPAIELLGFVQDLRVEYAACALALAPLREGGGLRVKVLEALAHRRTVVATPVGIAGIAVRDGVEARVAADAEAFAGAVVALLRDPGKRREMERAGRALVEREYSIERMATRSEEVFDELLARDAIRQPDGPNDS